MKLIYNDISKRLAEKCLETPDEPLEFHFVSRRHWIELIPEIIVALIFGQPLVLLTWTLMQGNGGPIIIAIVGLGSLIILAGLVFEIYRWDNDLVFLTQHGLARRRFVNFEWRNFRQSITSDTGTIKPFLFSLAGLNAGQMVAISFGTRPIIPLIPNVNLLHARMYKIPGAIMNVRTRAEAAEWEYEHELTQFESRKDNA